MDQMQTVPGPSQAAFNTLNNQVTNLIKTESKNITSDANSIIDLGISTSYAVISVFATLTNDVTCLPYRDTTGWKARLVNAKTGAALGEYNRSFMIVYVSV